MYRECISTGDVGAAGVPGARGGCMVHVHGGIWVHVYGCILVNSGHIDTSGHFGKFRPARALIMTRIVNNGKYG